MAYWKEHLHELWPRAGRLYRKRSDVATGELLGIDLGAGPATLSTGVIVIDSTDTAFTVLAPEGHMLAGWNRFSTFQTESGTEASITVEFRASDPLYELALLLGGHMFEDRFWTQMLLNLSERFDSNGLIRKGRVKLDSRRQWRRAANVRQNAFLLTLGRRLGRLVGLGAR
jgi:hypothetical protein